MNQGIDKTKRGRFVRENLSDGLNRIVALVEAHDRLLGQVLQLEEMQRLGLKPAELNQQLTLPEGQAAAVVLDPRWITHKVLA